MREGGIPPSNPRGRRHDGDGAELGGVEGGPQVRRRFAAVRDGGLAQGGRAAAGAEIGAEVGQEGKEEEIKQGRKSSVEAVQIFVDVILESLFPDL